jgi:DNA repair photolyase
MTGMKIKEIQCKSALSECGFSAGSFCINPYVGCGHACQYCYARFMKRFVGHSEPWGTFVDVKINIADVLEKQIKLPKYKNKLIYIGTVTDPYQPLERKYKLTRKILEILLKYQNPVEILTKSNLILRDIDLLKKFKDIRVNFTINTLDEKWKRLVEPYSSSIKERLEAAKKLSEQGIKTVAMMGRYWPFFTDPEKLFKEFKKAGISYLFTESFNMTGGNWSGVDKVLKKHYPELLPKMREIMLNKNNFRKFYRAAEEKVRYLSKKYKLPINIWFEK